MNVPGANPSLKMLRSRYWNPARDGVQRKIVRTAPRASGRHSLTIIPGPSASSVAGRGGGVAVGTGVELAVGEGVRVAASAVVGVGDARRVTMTPAAIIAAIMVAETANFK